MYKDISTWVMGPEEDSLTMRIRGMMVALLALTCSVPAVLAQSQTADQDKTFLKDATEGSLKEIGLSKLALEKSKDADVRMFATKMIHDHTMLINSMKPFAERWQVTPPAHMSATADAKYAELKVLTGDTFNKAYIKAMVADHHEDLGKFDNEIASTQNASFKAAVTKGRSIVQQHTDMIDGIAKKDGVS
jgi:putative membrane protein